MKQFVAITLSAIAVGFAADAANAQPDIATDHELLAAYCLGAANAVARQPTGDAQLDTMIEQDHQAKLVRLRAYLGAKGYLPTFVRSHAASQGILLFCPAWQGRRRAVPRSHRCLRAGLYRAARCRGDDVHGEMSQCRTCLPATCALRQ